MKKCTTIAALLMLLFGFYAKAQEPLKRRPGFSLDPKTMTELGLTDEQKNKIEDARNVYRGQRSKIEIAMRRMDTVAIRRQDSVLTAPQKQKVNVLRDAIAADNKPNPWYRKSLIPFDAKIIEELAITAEQQQKFKDIQKDYNNERRALNERFNKITTEAVNEQENMLNASQKQKMAEIKAEIIEHNKKVTP